MQLFLSILMAAGIVVDAPFRQVGVSKSAISEKMVASILDDISLEYLKEVDVNPIAFDYDPEYIAQAESKPAYADTMYFVPGANIEVKGRIHDYDRAPVSTVTQDGRTIFANSPRENVLPQLENPSFISRQRGFYIDKHPVWNEEYALFVRETGHVVPSYWKDGKIPAGMEQKPVVHVTYKDALDYAAWMGKRLPRASEFDRTSRKFPQFRRSSPQREWTSTVANPGKVPEMRYVYHGSPSDGRGDGYTGFRCAMDGR